MNGRAPPLSIASRPAQALVDMWSRQPTLQARRRTNVKRSADAVVVRYLTRSSGPGPSPKISPGACPSCVRQAPDVDPDEAHG